MTKNWKNLDKIEFCQRGAAAVEFALIAPLLLAFIFGIVAWGSYLAVVHGVQQLAAEAARFSIAGLSDSERSSLAQAYVIQHVSSYPLISLGRLSINAATSASDVNVFVVTVNYDASQMFLYALAKVVPLPSPNIASSAAIPRGGF